MRYKKLTKFIMLLHRYTGFVLSLLFLVWFLSGFMMMYVSYPTMKYQQRLQHVKPVDISKCVRSPQQALDAAGITDTITTMRLGMLLDRPIYRVVTKQHKHIAVFADNGEVLEKVDTLLAARIVQAFISDDSHPLAISKLTEIDQWMAAHRSQGYLPEVYCFEMDDAAKTYVYVAIQTGEVVQMLTAKQRFLAWLGPIPHWIYPTILIRNRPAWSQLVIWVSLAGTVMCLAGIIMGIIRFKRKNFTPYKKKWFRYHHYTGFIFGIFVFTWVLSRLFSMGPVDMGPDIGKLVKERQMLSGGPLNTHAFSKPAFADAQEIHLIQLDSKPYYLAYLDGNKTRLISADNTSFSYFSPALIIEKVKAFQPDQQIVEDTVLYHYDDYYYSRTNEKRLPVLRIKMNDPAQSWYYIDLRTGQLVLKHEKGSRVERWLYHGLHSFDLSFLYYKRPLWDIVMWVFLLGGTMVSITGVILTWKWVKRKI